MAAIEQLLNNYRRFIQVPHTQHLAGAEKVWFAVYDEREERRLRARLPEFEIATKHAGYTWKLLDLTNEFASWLSHNDYHDSYFEEPGLLASALPDFIQHCAATVKSHLTGANEHDRAVLAILGVAGLFGFMKVSELIEHIQEHIRGSLLVFFPGEYESNNYRLMDARDGWNYLAVPITAHEGDLKW